MLKYIARRLLVAIPTLFAILVISFLISRSVPGDPVYREMDNQFRDGANVSLERRNLEYARISHQKGLDLPVFYVSLSSIAYPDTLHRILELQERANLAHMVSIYGNWPEIGAYNAAVHEAWRRIRMLQAPADQKAQLLDAQRALEELKMVATETEIGYRMELLDSLRDSVPSMHDSMGVYLDAITTSFGAVLQSTSAWKLYVPSLHFHGLQNQFHTWFIALLHLDFGRSYVDHRPVIAKIQDALPWTVFMGFFSFLVSFMVAIPLGVYGVRKRNHWQDRTVTVGLFMLHSIPTFVAAMLAMTFLCNPDYLQLFPTSGVNSDGAEQWPLGYRLLDYAYHLTLPTLIFAYHNIAIISRQLRGGMLETVQADYIRTARAKGLPERTVIWYHALRNSILPIITLLSGLFTTMISGSIITEFIFSVPGMGQLTLDALSSFDHPVVIGVFTLTAITTLFGILFTDVLLALVDPRISF